MTKRVAIDLGTNTCLLLVADWDPNEKKILTVLTDDATVVRLGEGVDRARLLQKNAMERTLACLKRYAEKVRTLGGDPTQALCVATSQARDAKNSQEFFAQIQSETGFIFKTITGEQEADSTFRGALLPGMDPQAHSVIDIGGGSTELITLDESMSLDIGSVRFTERFLKSDPVTDAEFWACEEAIDQEIQPLLAWRQRHLQCERLVAVAGTATTLAAWHLGLNEFRPDKVSGAVLTRGDVHRLVEELKWRSVEERKALPSMEPMRADVILAGALILWRALELLQFNECVVSTRGLRYGVLSQE